MKKANDNFAPLSTEKVVKAQEQSLALVVKQSGSGA
jgi:hypothetical protein